MNDFYFNKKREEFEAITDGSNVSWLAFAYDPRYGSSYAAEIHHPQDSGLPSTRIELSHETLDAYIYGLQDIKQKLELIRSRQSNA